MFQICYQQFFFFFLNFPLGTVGHLDPMESLHNLYLSCGGIFSTAHWPQTPGVILSDGFLSVGDPIEAWHEWLHTCSLLKSGNFLSVRKSAGVGMLI